MRLLAIDTALNACAACVFDQDLDDPVVAMESLPMARGHAEALMPLVARVVEAGGGFKGLGLIAVTVGPGSFTGLRVAISAGRGFALALKIPCVGVTTLSAIAAPHIAEDDGHAVAAAIDARHGQLYFQLFAPRGRTVIELRCLPARDAARLLGSDAVKLAGPGAALLAIEARAAGVSYVLADQSAAPDIAWIARLALAADPDTARPRPFYIKPVDATAQQNGRIARA